MPDNHPKSRVTLRDIASEAGVSVACVSLALRNSPRISLEKRERIARICGELGYVRDGRLCELMSHLRHLDRNPRGATIAVVNTDPYSGEPDRAAIADAILMAVREEALREGYGVDVIDLAGEGISARRLRQILGSRGISGLIVLPGDDHGCLQDLDFSGLSVVAIGYEMESPTPHRVCANYLKMADMLMTRALAVGHRRIGFIPEQSQALLRNRMMAASIDFHLGNVPGAHRLPAYAGTLEDTVTLQTWLQVHRPDMVLGSRRAFERLEAIGCRLPGDFGFACWDATGMPEEVEGMNPRWDLQGREAVRHVVASLNRNDYGLPLEPGISVVDSDVRGGRTLGTPPLRSARVQAARQVAVRAMVA